MINRKTESIPRRLSRMYCSLLPKKIDKALTVEEFWYNTSQQYIQLCEGFLLRSCMVTHQDNWAFCKSEISNCALFLIWYNGLKNVHYRLRWLNKNYLGPNKGWNHEFSYLWQHDTDIYHARFLSIRCLNYLVGSSDACAVAAAAQHIRLPMR